MSFPAILRDYAIFNEGVYVGEGDTARVPKLAYKTEEWIGSGMPAPVEIDDHLEKLECEWSTKGFYDLPFLQFGERRLSGIGLRFVGHYQEPDTGAVDLIEVEIRGRHKEIDLGEFKRQDQGGTKVMSSLVSYKLLKNSRELIFVDTLSRIERYDGKDIINPIRQFGGF